MTRFRHSHLFLLLLVVLDLLFLFQIEYPVAEINAFLLRDFERALDILNGHFVAVGSDFTSGSYAPGPFYYLSILPALIFSPKVTVLVGYLLVMKVAVQCVFSITFGRLLKIPACFIYLFLASSAFILLRFIWVNNASVISIFLELLAILTLWYWQASERKEKWMLFAVGFFFCGFTQSHFSIFFAAPFLLFLIQQKTKERGGFGKSLVLFSGGFIVALIPFAVAIFNDKFLHALDGAVFFTHDLGAAPFLQDWMGLYSKTWLLFQGVSIYQSELLLILFYVFAKSSWILFRKSSPHTALDKMFLLLGTMCLIFSGWILSGLFTRYSTVFFVIGLTYFIYDLHGFLIKHLKREFLVIIAACGICAIPVSAFYRTQKTHGLVGKCEACIRQLEMVCDHFNSKNISFEEFSTFTYELYQTQSGISMEAASLCFKKQTGFTPNTKTRYLFVGSDLLESPEDLPLSIAALPREIRSDFLGKNLNEELKTPGFTLFSVQTEKTLDPKIRLTNLTYIYEMDPGVGEKYQLDKYRRDWSHVYKASFCKSRVFCDLYVFARVENNKLDVRFLSRLFQTKFDNRPVCGRLTDLKLHYRCDETAGSFEIASSVGASIDEGNETFFTPVKVTKDFPCKNWKLTSISADRVTLNFYSRVENSSNAVYELQAY